jgi:hypothetical protein
VRCHVVFSMIVLGYQETIYADIITLLYDGISRFAISSNNIIMYEDRSAS